VPWTVQLWKKPLKWLGNLAMIGGVLGVAIHYLRFGPKDEGLEQKPTPPPRQEPGPGARQ